MLMLFGAVTAAVYAVFAFSPPTYVVLLVGVAIAGAGHWITGIVAIVCAYAASLLLVERLFRIVELEVIVYELRPKPLGLLPERGTLRVDFYDTREIFHLVKRVPIGHCNNIAGDEGSSCQHPGRHQTVTVWHNKDR